MSDLPGMRLGKLPPRRDPRSLQLGWYLDLHALPEPPAATSRLQPTDSWPMFANDTVGDCTLAAAGHMIDLWDDLTGNTNTLTDQTILDAYAAITGYTPTDPSTDRGADELSVLNYWRTVGIGGHQIVAHTDVNPSHLPLVRAATWLFDGLYIGVALPITAQDQDVWDVVPHAGADGQPGSWGGHAVDVADYDAEGLTIITWGAPKRMTWAFWRTYVDEAHAIISPDAFSSAQLTPEGFNRQQLLADLAGVTS